MKASILAVTISSLLSAHAIASTPKVDVELANSHTNQLITDQMGFVDASVQAQLNAQHANAVAGTTATLDDVNYEKQANGTWAAVGAASATLVAGLLSSSSTSSNSDGNDTPPALPLDSLAMDDLGTWEGDNSGYVLTVAGESIHVDAENVVDNGNGTATITVDDQKLTLGINGDTIYWVDQVEHPEVEAPEFGDDRPEMEERDLTVKIVNGEIHIIDENTSEWVGTVQRKDGELVFIGNGDFNKTLLKVEGDLEADGTAAIVKGNAEWVATIERVDNGFELTGKNGTIVVNSPRPNLPTSPEHPDLEVDDTPRWAPEFGDDRPEMEERDLTIKIVNGEIHIIDENTSEWVGTVQRKDGELVFIGNGDFEKTLLKVEGDISSDQFALVKGNGQWVATVSKVENGLRVQTKNHDHVFDGSNIDRSKLQNINPTKLQKAKSAIQQRLRG
ncbi:hypothetical protein [Vibrio maerlii]|uniref:hypothetical protein n=1 Tax=Vibrio maerlii TaxID=2231648 RepID=UPI000F4DB959|nr:hypothetical protein [Vibrio maerlii]